ncbi:MAG TPA: glucokinase [Pseudomonadales bacterium]
MNEAAGYLIADIGGTNARFAWASDAGMEGERVVLASADFADATMLVQEALRRLDAPLPAAAGLAVAGPVAAGRARLTNGRLSFDEAALARALECPVVLINDFQAIARSLPELTRLRQYGGQAPMPGPKAALGPGTGLGMGVVVPVNGRWQVLASEGGHGDLAPGNPLEAEVLRILQTEHSHVSWEIAVSGPGLVRLYGAVCRIWGTEPEELSAEQISARGVHATDPVCHQTLELFFALLGAAAGNLALTVCAYGGVYIAGGIVPELADFAEESPMRRRFEERGRMSDMVRPIPLFLIEEDAPGMTGVLCWVRDRFGG